MRLSMDHQSVMPLSGPYYRSTYRTACMPSFDIVSELDAHEVTNAIDQSNREVSTRFDFKGTGAEIQIKDFEVTLIGNSPFQLQQLRDILNPKLAKRGVDLQCLKGEQVRVTGKKRDDLQEAIALLRKGDFGLPLQFTNFRD